MDTRLKVTIAVAAPLAAAGAACAWAFLRPADAPALPLAPLASSSPATAAHCRRAAELLWDVSWAAACFKTADDSNDCMLPDAQAAKVNALLESEERRCMAAEAQAMADR